MSNFTGAPKGKELEKIFEIKFPSFINENGYLNFKVDGNEVLVTTVTGKKISFVPAKEGDWDKFIQAAADKKGDKVHFYNTYIDGDEYWYLKLFPELDVALIDESYVGADSKDGQYELEAVAQDDYNKEFKLGKDNNEDDFLVIAKLAQYTLFLKYFGKLNEGEVNDFEVDLFSYAMKCQTR